MKEGQKVFVITRSQNVAEGILGEETTDQGFYTRWGTGHLIHFRFRSTITVHPFNDENIFCTKEAAKKELFTRRLRYPNLMRGRAA